MSLAKAGQRRQGLSFFKRLVEQDKLRRKKMLLGADYVMLIYNRENNPTEPKAILLFFSIKKNDLCTGKYKSNSVKS